MQLYKTVGDLVGEAGCMLGFGDIERARSDHSAARVLYERALALYRRCGSADGEAIALRRLESLDGPA